MLLGCNCSYLFPPLRLSLPTFQNVDYLAIIAVTFVKSKRVFISPPPNPQVLFSKFYFGPSTWVIPGAGWLDTGPANHRCHPSPGPWTWRRGKPRSLIWYFSPRVLYLVSYTCVLWGKWCVLVISKRPHCYFHTYIIIKCLYYQKVIYNSCSETFCSWNSCQESIQTFELLNVLAWLCRFLFCLFDSGWLITVFQNG